MRTLDVLDRPRSPTTHPAGLVTLRLGISRIYLLPCTGGYLQIDTAYHRQYADYRTALVRAGIGLEQLPYLLLTHHHDDHAGFLGPLTRDKCLTVIAHRDAEALLAGGANDKSHGGGFVTRRMNLLARIRMRLDPNWTLTFPPFLLRPNDIRVDSDDDELLRSLGIPGRVLTTPGHTVDSLSVILDDGSAFCGDAAANMFRVAGTRHCTVFMTDMDVAYDSWRKLIAAGARTIYPAHGRPFDAQLLRRDLDAHSTAELVRFF